MTASDRRCRLENLEKRWSGVKGTRTDEAIEQRLDLIIDLLILLLDEAQHQTVTYELRPPFK